MVSLVRVIVVCFLYLAILSGYASSCKCLVQTDEQKFCSSEWGGLVKVESDTMLEEDVHYQRVYRVKFIAVTKGRRHIKTRRRNIHTASESAACGVNLVVGAHYILSGYVNEEDKKLRINSCGSVRKLVTDSFWLDACPKTTPF